MNVIFVFNGLGNQMSQYALYLHKKALGQKVRCVFKNTAHNGIELNRLFGIDIDNSSFSSLYKMLQLLFSYMKCRSYLRGVKWILNKLHINGFIEEDDYSYNSEILEERVGLNIYAGGWHHYKYIEPIGETIRELYKFPVIEDEANIEIIKAASLKNSVAIHIRRGDYLNGKFGAVCNETYYKNSIQYIESLIDSPKYYVFSNDMEWSREFLKGKDAVFVDWNVKEDSWKDMALMKSFKKLIIANSTFSWWAGWLGHDNLVLCPPYFVGGEENSDIYPPEWVKIKNR